MQKKKKKNERSRATNRFLGILFRCCNTYGRIYRNREQTAYVGMCPRCGKRIAVAIGKEGTDARFFIAE